MSFFGKNIKKIRSVKGLSQQAFAELFDLKREIEAYADEEDTKEITYELLLSSSIDPFQLYPNPVNNEYTGHFRSVKNVIFNPASQ